MVSPAKYIQRAKNVSLAYSKFYPDRMDCAEWEQMLETNHENTGALIKDFDNLMQVCDVTVWQIMHTMKSVSLFMAYRDIYNKQKPILVEIDDDVFDVNPENLGFDAYNPNSNMEYFAEIQMRNANGLIVSTDYLKQRLARFNPCIEVIPNGIDFEIWDKLRNRRSHKNIRIGWAGSQAHADKDLNVIMKVMPIILQKYKNVEFYFMGGKPRDLKESERVKFHGGWYNIFQYPQELAKLGFDIGLAPLRDNLFNRAKSNLRWLEYSALKIPTIASNVEPFKKSINNKLDGLLVEYDVQEWVDALSYLIEKTDIRENMGKLAYSRIKQDFNAETIAGQYLQLLHDFVNGKIKMNMTQYEEQNGQGVYRVKT
jgi:glycosyltransferase involved in cell wall biosynthesis